MIRLYAIIIAAWASAAMLVNTASAQGWPANYDGVMLQGFYWDSYDDTQWTKFEKQADELAHYFSLVWVPQSGNCDGKSMGYNPKYYFDQNSSFGTEAQLRSMIKTFKAKGIGTIADVVINHRQNATNWVDFPAETYKGVTYQMKSTDICADDDGGKAATEAAKLGLSLSPNKDSGEGWDGMRDLDHASENVQNCIFAYEDFLINDLGYAGFRYDVGKGFAAKYFALYNQKAKPQFSVGEVWDSNQTIKNWIDGTKIDGVPQSGAFDFQFRYQVRDAVNGNDYSKLSGTNGLIFDANYRQYAVTFVENHDMEYRSNGEKQDPILKDTLGANAYMLAMPGTPCVFFTHWKAHRNAIKQMIEARHLVGITNTSTFVNLAKSSSYVAYLVTGTKGKLILVVGTGAASYAGRDGFKELISGKTYRYFVSDDVDTDGWQDILTRIEEESPAEEPQTFTLPDCAVVQEGTYAYFEKPASWKSTINVWAWNTKANNANAYDGASWPGTVSQKDVTIVGKNNDNDVYLWKYSGTGTPNMIIFNDGSSQTKDMEFVNGSYYLYDGSRYTVTSTGEVAYDGKYVGGDISMLPAYEDAGNVYFNADGEKIEDLLRYFVDDCGWNTFRVRLFVNPSLTNQQYQDISYVKKLGKRIKDLNAKFMLDIHYSDSWADPSKQFIPSSWTDTSDEALAKKVGEYTSETLKALKEYGAEPDLVQIGNEISYGMLLRGTTAKNGTTVSAESDKVYPSQARSQRAAQWDRLALLLNAGAKAVRDNSKAKIVLHIERSGESSQAVNFFTNIGDVDYDIIGLSYYPFWHGYLDKLGYTIAALNKNFPTKQVQVVETAYNFQYNFDNPSVDTSSKWPISVQGQYNFVSDLITELAKYDNVNGLSYWFPEESGNGDNKTVMNGWVNRGLWWPAIGGGGGHWPVNVNKTTDVAHLMKTFLDEEQTGIDGIYVMPTLSNVTYNLAGQRINLDGNTHKGIVIRNGKKILMK